MLTRSILAGLFAMGVATSATPAETHSHVTDFSFSFEGPFGSFNQAQLQRGLQVYTEICSACHGLMHLAYRNLSDPGGPALSEEQMRAYAAQFEVEDPETGEFRPATPTDHFPVSSLSNAPDLSLMAKARAGFHGPMGLGLNQLTRGMGGPEYIASFLVGFTGEEKEEAGVLLYENSAKGAYVAMNPVLYGDDVTYEDGTEASAEQIAQDVAAFLMWTAEPKMMARKQSGLTVLLYFTNKQLWAPYKGEKKSA